MKLSSIEEFEIKAEAFRLTTGMMAPGKDTGLIATNYTFEDRCIAYTEWELRNKVIINAMIKAINSVLKTQEDEQD